MAMMTAILANSPLKLSLGLCPKGLISTTVRYSPTKIRAHSSTEGKNAAVISTSPPKDEIYENTPGLWLGLGMGSGSGLGLGLGLGLGFASQAYALEEIARSTANESGNDSRGLLLLVVLAPAIGWVLFNILRPALNQIDKMRSSSKSIVVGGGLGIGAISMLSAPPDAGAISSDEFALIAASADNDSRGLLLLIVLLPAIGWVLFNILRPALNQLNKMRGK